MNRCNITQLEQIAEEDWKKASGVKYTRGETNAALTPRDYTMQCNGKFQIAYVEGYYIWWCSTHHQPLAHCREAKLAIELEKTQTRLKQIHDLAEE